MLKSARRYRPYDNTKILDKDDPIDIDSMEAWPALCKYGIEQCSDLNSKKMKEGL